MRSQIEIGTGICETLGEARDQLRRFRTTFSEVAARHGCAIVAASTHPFADWGGQKHTDKERYNALARDIGGPVRRLLICGMHVHVGIEDPELRIDLMSQASYFLPHLLALSTSSPFWRGADTGLKSYRLAVFNELPRTGLPRSSIPSVNTSAISMSLISAGLIEDGSKIWWDLRPSARFRRSKCASPMPARSWKTRWPSPPCTAASCACSIACAAATSAGGVLGDAGQRKPLARAALWHR